MILLIIMKKLNKIYQNLNYILISLLIIFTIPKTIFANDNLFINIENNENGNLNCFTSTKDAGMTMKGEAKF